MGSHQPPRSGLSSDRGRLVTLRLPWSMSMFCTGLTVMVVSGSLAACGGDAGSGKPAGGSDTTHTASTSSGADLTGAGATFPYPIYSKWFAEYATKTGGKINYQSI